MNTNVYQTCSKVGLSLTLEQLFFIENLPGFWMGGFLEIIYAFMVGIALDDVLLLKVHKQNIERVCKSMYNEGQN